MSHSEMRMVLDKKSKLWQFTQLRHKRPYYCMAKTPRLSQKPQLNIWRTGNGALQDNAEHHTPPNTGSLSTCEMPWDFITDTSYLNP